MSSEYLGTWSHTERDRKINDLEKRYHELTEAYDRTVCTGRIVNGAIQPSTPTESALINRNARTVLKSLMLEAESSEIAKPELMSAIRRK